MCWPDALLQSLVNTCVGRFDSYTVQRENGQYWRVSSRLTYGLLRDHLSGSLTLGTYAITERGQCRFAVFDADDEAHGFLQMVQLQQTLAGQGVPSYLEESRRGAHLWVFLASPCLPSFLRRALLPYCPVGVEFFPKQDTASFEHPGAAVRLPLGVHRKTGRRYPFVVYQEDSCLPSASTIGETLCWLSQVERVSLSVLACLAMANDQQGLALQKKCSPRTRVAREGGARWDGIADWRAEQDPIALIGRYVALDSRGMGCCPFGWHHERGEDLHPSLWVYDPASPGGCCWYCHAWKQGGSVFDFLLFYYGLSTRELWHRILSGEQF